MSNDFSSLSEKIEVAEHRINELKTLINHWKGDTRTFWDNECSEHPSSPSCLLFEN